MNDHITINGERFLAEDLRLIAGEDEVLEIEGFNLLVARALKNPMRLPWLLKDICNICLNEDEMREMRLALIRVQVDAELRMNQDIQRYQQRRYVAQVMEVLLFNELMLAPRETVEEGAAE